MDQEEKDFLKWLLKRNYRETTAKNTVANTRQVFNQWVKGKKAPHPSMTVPLRRALQYFEERGQEPDFCAWLRSHGITPRDHTPAPKPAGRKLEARSFSEDDYRKLRMACANASDPEAIVLDVMLTTGLRVGDVLRLPTETLGTCVQNTQSGDTCLLPLERKGGTWIQVPIEGALPEWQRLYEDAQDFTNIAEYVTDGESDSALPGGPAYTRLDRYLKALGEHLGLRGRVHLHRIRRTVAVRALAASERDLVGVQQLLAHKTINTTQRYVDEIDSQRVTQIQKLIR